MGTRSLATKRAGAGDVPAAGAARPAPSPSPVPAARPGEPLDAARPGTGRVLPDPAICRAEAMGLADYAACLVHQPFQCPHALGFGWSFLCRHPHRDEIVTRTEACG